MPESGSSPSLAKRALAILILAIAGWILLKVVIHVIAAVSTVIVVIAAIAAVIWALRTL